MIKIIDCTYNAIFIYANIVVQEVTIIYSSKCSWVLKVFVLSLLNNIPTYTIF